MTCGKRKDNSLDPCLTNHLGRGDRKLRKRERKDRDFGERSSTFSLKFPVIGPSNPASQETKLLPTVRATRGYWFCGFSTTP